MRSSSESSGSQNQQKYHALRSQLVGAIFGSNSAYSGEQIYALLDEMRELIDDSLTADFAQCEALVQQWKDTWYPDFSG
ncbi:MAG: hypothetical protein RLP44_31680 [Aggregatilineales bacterium]